MPDHAVLPVTSRERECLEGLAQGLTNAGIAKRLHIALPTVALHLANARRKLGARSREQAVALAVKLGLIEAQQSDVKRQAVVFLSVAEHAAAPGEPCRLSEPRPLEVERTISGGNVELDVEEIGFKITLAEPDALLAVHVRVVGTDVTIQPLYRGPGERGQRTVTYSSSGDKSCVCWDAAACVPSEKKK